MDEGPSLTVRAVAARLGIAPGTLRTWHRRYGIGPTSHESGRHRQYSVADVRRLEAMNRLVQSGVAPAEAAAAALREQAEPAGPAAIWTRPEGEGRPGGPGGRVIAAGRDAPPVLRGLGRAAQALDAPSVTRLMEDAVAQRGVCDTWTEVLQPFLRTLGERWEASGRGVEVEHMVSDVAAAVFSRRLATPMADPGVGPVLLTCIDGEQHALPMTVLAAAVRERCGVGARLLGAGMPVAALTDAVSRTRPSVVVVWSLMPLADTADSRAFVASEGRTPGMCAAGPGWESVGVADHVTRLRTLDEALTFVEARVGPVGGQRSVAP